MSIIIDSYLIMNKLNQPCVFELKINEYISKINEVARTNEVPI